MFEIFKTVLQDGMEIDNFRELSNKYKFTLKYQGIGYACVLEKSCTPGHEKEFCKRIINGAVGSMYLNSGNKKEAVAWLNGERWNEEKDLSKDQYGRTNNKFQTIRDLDRFDLALLLNDIKIYPEKYPNSEEEWLKWLNMDSGSTIDTL
jgi:hypothetical protein